MSNVQETLISIYDAAIDQSRWQEALDNITAMVGSSSASLLLVPTATGQFVDTPALSLRVLSGQLATVDPGLIDQYIAQHAVMETDAWQHLRKLPPGSLLTDSALYPDLQSVLSRPDYQYLIHSLNLFRRMIARLNDNRFWYDAIAFQWHRSVTEIPNQAIEQAKIVLPHLSKAFQLARRNHQLRERYQAVIGALDKVEIGVCIADRNARLVVCNREAQRILEMDDGLRINHEERLVANDPGLDAQLGAAIQQIALTAAGQAFRAGETLLADRPSDEHPFLIDVMPIRDTLGEFKPGMAGALITIIDPDNHRPFQTGRVALAYRLSDAEAEVCRFVVEGKSNQAIAEERSVSLDTVKTQVKSIMSKTGTRRRADLIRLVVNTASPISLDDPP